MSEDRSASPAPSPLRVWLALALVVIAALGLLLPGLGETGLWTVGELPILERTLAALGEPRSELVRSPWLPDQLRTWSYAALGRSDAALRVPGALAGVGLVALTMVCARRLGWAARWIALSGCFALALPVLLASSRTVLGNPSGELWVAAASLALIHGLETRPQTGRKTLAWRAVLIAVGLAFTAAATASLGIVLGCALPLTLVALADVARGSKQGGFSLPRWAVYAAWSGAAVAGFAGLWLAHEQGEGYIPLLGAAKDLELLADPTSGAFTDSLERLGYQLFPFTGLVALGLLGPGRARWPALWFGVGVVIASVWSMAYGTTNCPVAIPAALLATAACERMFDPDEPIAARRMLLFCAILAALVLGKDAGRTPRYLASPLFDLPALEFPSAGLVASFNLEESLPKLAKSFAGLLLLAHILAPPSRTQRSERDTRPGAANLDHPLWRRLYSTALDRLRALGIRLDQRVRGFDATRAKIALGIVFLALAQHAWGYGRQTLDAVNTQLSIAEPLRRFEAAVERGELPNTQLALHRVRDPGLSHYGPGPERELILANRAKLDRWLADPSPHTALIRRSDFPAVFKASRRDKRALYVLDMEHHDYVLVANFLPEGREDQNPLSEIVYDEPVTLAHQTLVSWDPYVELIAWEIEGELHRGAKATMHMVFRVKRSLPAGSKLYARLQRGKSSRVAPEPHELTGGVFPPNYWRAGDYVHHALEFEVPWLEVLPGEHEVIVGLRRSEKTNFKISLPTKTLPSEHGVKLRGKSQEFVVIGVADVAW